MSEKIKLTEEELKKIKELKQEFNEVTQGLGIVEIQKFTLEKKKRFLEEELERIYNSEGKIAKDLEKKYGKGTISLENGEFVSN